MTKKFLIVLGAGFIFVGLVGLVTPHFMGAHLSWAHNLIHLVSGGLALYFALRTSGAASRQFAFVFGIVYALLGIVGFVVGVPIVASIHGMEQASTDSHLLMLVPGVLVFGTSDHIMHLVIGLLFLCAAVISKRPLSQSDYTQRVSES